MTREPAWLRRVRAGDFAVIPAPFRFRNSIAVAHLLDGYRYAGGMERLDAMGHALVERWQATGVWEGSALDLWAVLFRLHRASRFSGVPDDEEPDEAHPLGDPLCEALRERLILADETERAAIVAELAKGPAFGPGATRRNPNA